MEAQPENERMSGWQIEKKHNAKEAQESWNIEICRAGKRQIGKVCMCVFVCMSTVLSVLCMDDPVPVAV